MWRKVPDWLIYLVIIIAIYANANRAAERVDASPPPPELGPMLPNQTPRDEQVMVNVKRPDSGVGTAFAMETQTPRQRPLYAASNRRKRVFFWLSTRTAW